MFRGDIQHETIPPVFAGITPGDIDIMLLTVDIAHTPHGDEEPVAFLLGTRRVQVIEILDRWLSAQQNYFKVLADDGSLYILRQDAATREWEMTLFRAEP